MIAPFGCECRESAEYETDQVVEAIIADQSREGEGVARQRQNQILIEAFSLKTLQSTLIMREEQAWGCSECRDSGSDDK